MTQSTLAVLMAVYNKAPYLEEALDSIFTQSAPAQEIIIVEDKSMDHSLEILEGYQKRYPLIHLIRNERNRGAVCSYNRALEASSADYLYIMGADDIILPGFFEKALAFLKQFPSAGLCTSNPVHYFEKEERYSEYPHNWSKEPSFFTPEEFAEVISGGYIASHGTIVNKRLILKTGVQLPELKWYADWFSFLVLAFRHGVCYIPEPWAVLRVKESSYSCGSQKWEEQREILASLLRLLESAEYRDVLPLFVRGGVMHNVSHDIVRLVMMNPELWNVTTLMLIQEPLYGWGYRLKEIQAQRWEKAQRPFAFPQPEENMKNLLEQGKAALTAGRWEDALSVFTEYVREYPRMSGGYIGVASVGMGKKDYRTAREFLFKAIELEPNNAGLHNQMGVAQYRLGEGQMAANAFRQALALDPANLNARLSLAEIARSEGRYEVVGEYLLGALKDNPEDADLWMACGNYALEVDDSETAQAAFQRAFELDPSREEAREGLGMQESTDRRLPPDQMQEPIFPEITFGPFCSSNSKA